MAERYKDCQSCGMPLSKDEQGGGTEADGTRSLVYCSHCYQRGSFTMPNLTMAQMQDRVKDKMKEMKIPGFLAYFFAKKIPKLKRWQTNP
jgi:putative zinc ribbon protein